ncbi:MAG: DUF1273 family protein [Clostridia bacterium]|nr:DUF1273 family protein [Clostridia bacterium]
MKACCFTGHRDIPAHEEEQLKARILREIYNLVLQGVTVFRNGGALGFDMLAAECVIEQKEAFPDIKLVMDVPHRGQADAWPAEQQQRYHLLLEMADEVNVLSERYFRGCMYARNRHMVDHSELLIAYVRKSTGGSYYTRSYALEQGKTVVDV